MTDFGLNKMSLNLREASFVKKILYLFSLLQMSATASLCPNFNYALNDAAVDTHLIPEGVKVNIGNYTCPGANDPKLNTECCSKMGMNGCCPPEERYFYEIDSKIAAIVAITVISSCIFVTIIITICCFWSRCPLYTACRVEYTSEIATYESKGDAINMDTMPVELTGKESKFTPVIISNGNLDADNNPL